MPKCKNGLHEMTPENSHQMKDRIYCRACEYTRKKRWADKSHYWDRYRFGGNKPAVLERDGNACVGCFAVDNLTVDHIDRDRNNNSLDNLQTLCRPCHGAKDGPAGLGIKKSQGKYA